MIDGGCLEEKWEAGLPWKQAMSNRVISMFLSKHLKGFFFIEEKHLRLYSTCLFFDDDLEGSFYGPNILFL